MDLLFEFLYSYKFSTIVTFLVIASLFLISVRSIREYERVVVFRLGRFIGVRKPGLILVLPLINQIVKVDLRTTALDIPSQVAVTKDKIIIKVMAVILFRIINPATSIIQVKDYLAATLNISKITVIDVVSQFTLEELMTNREKINSKLRQIIDEEVEPWGLVIKGAQIRVEVESNDAIEERGNSFKESETQKKTISHTKASVSHKDNIRELIIEHTRRLHELEKQTAKAGIAVDPKIVLEIEDIKVKIEELQEELEIS